MNRNRVALGWITFSAVLLWTGSTQHGGTPTSSPAIPTDTRDFQELADKQHEGNQADLKAELQTLEREVASLHREMAELKDAFVTASSTTESGPSPMELVENTVAPLLTSQQIAEAQQVAEDLEQKSQALQEQRIAALQKQFAAEITNPHWADDRSRALRSAFERFPEATRESAGLLDLECRSTTCRLEVEFDSAAARSGFEMPLMQVVGTLLPTVVVKEAAYGAGFRVTYFLQGRPDGPS